MTQHQVLDALAREYRERAVAIRRDLMRQHEQDSAEQAQQRQNDEVLEALLAEAEIGLQLVSHAQQRLSEGRYGICLRCGGAIAESRLSALPAAEYCLGCVQEMSDNC